MTILVNNMSKDLKFTTVERARRPLGVPSYKMPVPDMPGFVARWMNDVVGRLSAAVDGGYEFVAADEFPSMGGTEVTPGNSDLGSRVSRVVGVNPDGSPLRAYLMRIRKEWYDTDQASKAQNIDATADAIRRGSLNANPGENRYVKQISVR